MCVCVCVRVCARVCVRAASAWYSDSHLRRGWSNSAAWDVPTLLWHLIIRLQRSPENNQSSRPLWRARHPSPTICHTSRMTTTTATRRNNVHGARMTRPLVQHEDLESALEPNQRHNEGAERIDCSGWCYWCRREEESRKSLSAEHIWPLLWPPWISLLHLSSPLAVDVAVLQRW